MSTFRYKKQSFFIECPETFSKSTLKMLLCSPDSSLFADEHHEDRISINHELNHYLQDMSCMACITEDQFRDHIAGLVAILSRVDGILYPLEVEDNKRRNLENKTLSEDVHELVSRLYTAIEIYNLFFVSKYEIDSPVGKIKIGYADLLETYAYHKSYAEQYICSTEANVGVLHQITSKNHVFPYEWDNDSLNVRFDLFNMKANGIYQNIMMLTLFCIQHYVSMAELLDYYKKTIPSNYLYSPAYLHYRLTMSLIEASLMIPSVDAILNDYEQNKDIFIYSPIHRFFQFFLFIRDSAPALPEKICGEQYQVTFTEWICQKCGLPSFSDCVPSLRFIMQRAESGRESIVNNQLNVLSHKYENNDRFLHEQPIVTFKEKFLPIVIFSDRKLNFYAVIGENHIMDYEGASSFYGQYFSPHGIDLSGVIKYEHYNENRDFSDNLKAIMNNGTAIYREVACRLLSHAVTKAYLKDGYFSCPFCSYGCPNTSSECKSFRHFINVIQHCSNIVKYANGKRVMVDSGEGNSFDCMFLDYLLTYNINNRL